MNIGIIIHSHSGNTLAVGEKILNTLKTADLSETGQGDPGCAGQHLCNSVFSVSMDGRPSGYQADEGSM